MKMPSSLVVIAALTVGSCRFALCYELSLSFMATSVVENAGGLTAFVNKTGSGQGRCVAGYGTVVGSAFPSRDFVSSTGVVEFTPADTVIGITIQIVSNTVPEPSRFFQIILRDLSNCVAGAITTGTVAILDEQSVEAVSQGFESGMPQGWSNFAHAYTNGYWRFDDPGGQGNYTGGRGAFAVVDSDYYGENEIDAELRTAPFAVASTALTYLVFRTEYISGASDVADVDVNLAGGEGAWTNLWRRTAYDCEGPDREFLDLTPVARGESNVIVRFHYYNAYYDWYWEVDDVAILVEADSNTNGLPDWWEMSYFSVITNVPPRGDSDGDGACDEDEFIAGTNPVDTGSCFRATGIIRSNLTAGLSFDAQLSHYYDVQSSTNLMSPIWSNRISRILGMGGRTNISLGAPGPNGVYRLNVRRW